MRILTPEEFNKEKFYFLDIIKNGAVFVYPTDTIYGLGCNALVPKSVRKIRQLKDRPNNPFSVIVPSNQWILENCVVDANGTEWLNKIPGPYTLIFRLKKNCVAKQVNPNLDTLGIRIPKHWISNFVAELKVPIVTTSVNKAGADFMASLEDIDNYIKSNVDFIIYEGEKKGNPSKIIDLSNKLEIIEG